MSRNDVILCLLAVGMLGGLAALAQDEESQQEADVAETEEAPESEDVFIPTEEVQAAEEITFPVNI